MTRPPVRSTELTWRKEYLEGIRTGKSGRESGSQVRLARILKSRSQSHSKFPPAPCGWPTALPNGSTQILKT